MSAFGFSEFLIPILEN